MQYQMNYALGMLILALSSSAQGGTSFRDYYYGNERLGIPSHEKKINDDVATGILNLNNKDLTDLTGFDEVPGLNTLRKLTLWLNLLTTFPNNIFRGLTSLETLDLNTNRLAILPNNIFHGLSALRTLILSNNQLTALPEDIFHGLTMLQELYLTNNQIATLPVNIFHGLTALRSLFLNGNRIHALPENVFHGLTSLPIINLSFNQLTTLPENIFHGLTGLRYLYLYNNPIPLTQAQLYKQLQLPANAHLTFKDPAQEIAEQNLFAAIADADTSTVRHQLNTIMTKQVRGPATSVIDISKIRNAKGDNLLHAAIREAAERLGVVKGMSAGIPENEKKEVKELQAEQKSEINNRYMKIISAILSCGEICVQDMLFTPNAEGQMTIDAMVAKLGFDSPIIQAILSGLSAEEKAKEKKEQHEAQK